jgi:CHAD domain-containing protein
MGLEVGLMASQARLEARTDPEALHDLRTTVRRLRSLLRPLRGLPGVAQLEAAASRVGDLTTPLRDREVLAAYLLEHDQPDEAHRRMAQMAEAYPAVAASTELAQLLQILDAFPRFLRASQRQGLLKGLRPNIEKRLAKQWKKLDTALHDPAHDRHRLRLLIKRVRYGIEAYPELDRLPKAAMPRLKAAQAALGDWHD